ncbi:MAG: HlyD family type I secretion periplasmic adaptor subunit [Gammaproteobacteria bacterium]|nr:HlyD family type I secretion periplasmic adaptor subunit [Gammaproteobacteria bacterium]
MNRKQKFSDIDKFRLREVDEVINHVTPRGGRLIIWSILLFIACVLLWTSVAEIDEVTRGEGKVIPARQVQVLQNLEGGIVAEILVAEGDLVDQGQVLIRLDNTQFSAALREGETHCMEHRAKVARLEAEAAQKDFVIPKEVLAKYPEFVKREYELYRARKGQFARQEDSLQKELDMMRPLVEQGAVSEIEVLRLERKLNELQDDYCTGARTELNDLLVEISRLQQSNQMLRDKLKRTEITAPLKGIIKQVKVNTIGGVIQPGMDVIEIVPLNDSLLIEARIAPANIGFIHPGQKVMVKITAYDFAIYGGLVGEIENIGADTIVDDESGSFYRIRVRTDKNKLGTDQDPLPIIPGMSATVDILTGKKTVLHYLLKPVLRAKEMAFRER